VRRSDGITLGEGNLGHIYSDIQMTLLNYKKIGTLLAIASKNNLDDVLPVFSKPSMLLKKDDFVTMRINWNPKSVSIREIAEELNLGLDSFIFLDDNPAERLEVSTALPMVQVIDFPSDISRLPALLKSIPTLKKVSLTEEDTKRHELYVTEKNRQELQKILPLEDYLSALDINIQVSKDDEPSLARITQLITRLTSSI